MEVTKIAMSLEKSSGFLSVCFGAGTSTKGKYAELLSWLANLSAIFLFGRKPSCMLSLYPQICIFLSDHSSLTYLITNIDNFHQNVHRGTINQSIY